jgi:Uma2 family endonuclease
MMTTAAIAPPSEPTAIPTESVYQLSVEQYHQMADAGILTTEDRVELIEGILVKKTTIYPLHALVVDSLEDAFSALALPGWIYRSQQPITLAVSEPEPDGALVRGRRSDYRNHHPSPPNVGIVIEVAESLLDQDRGLKKRAYARAGIPVYWIVNLIDKTVEFYSAPARNDYPPARVYATTDKVPVELEGKQVGMISVAALFGE